jgi:serine/threonine-protein kinase PknG
MAPRVEACRRPGCSGQIEDGFCTVCGLAPEGAAAGAPYSGVTATAASDPSSLPRTTRTTRSARTSPTGSTRRRASGVALSALPPIPLGDPLAALVPGEVPERRRFCSNCDGKLNLEAGFCPRCGQQYSFRPSLQPGQVVAGKYEIKGTLAFGGLGWIYLAMDTVLNRWIVLKGLLNSRDPNMVRVAVQEREFLAAVKHPNIVGIYDFITEGAEGFIVMEYVNGKSLLRLRREHDGPLPALEACSYILELLPAFTYLHQMGLVYCDFKIDNAVVEGDTVKLIDMGAVRRLDDTGGDVYGTRGYAAPEASDDPTPVSDLYTTSRALAVLITDFDFQGAFEHSLPAPKDVPVFTRYPSLYRFLLKATRLDPDARFQTADEMAAQLQGVLRDVAAGTGVLGPVDSSVFEGETGSNLLADQASDGALSRQLPGLRPAATDPGAPAILAASLVPDPARRLALLEHAWAAYPESLQLPFGLAGAHIDAGSPDSEVERWLAQAAAQDPGDWRGTWYRGQAALAHGDAPAAVQAFDSVLAEVPGELAPKLALAHAYELGGDTDLAAANFDLVSRADPSYTSAAFGLARCRRARGDRDGAVEALERVPPTSSRYESARLAIADILTDERPSPPGAAELARAADVLEPLRATVGTLALHRLVARLLLAASRMADGRGGWTGGPPGERLLGVPLRRGALRAGAERELRVCAHLAATRTERIRYVDEANRARPFTLV